jgi:hypothetical protein
LAKINIYHATLFAEFIAKLRATPDGDATLLDHTVMIWRRYGGLECPCLEEPADHRRWRRPGCQGRPPHHTLTTHRSRICIFA